MNTGGSKLEDGELTVQNAAPPLSFGRISADRLDVLRTSPSQRLCVSAWMLFCLCLGAAAKDYSIDWHTVDGGGGTSTGGMYSITGTIGQPDASPLPLAGGPYTLTRGFWTIQAIQTSEAPWLTIIATGPGQITLSWEPGDNEWTLQETSSLSPPTWFDSTSGSTNPVTVPAAGAIKFYRLLKR